MTTKYFPDGIECSKCDRFVNEIDENGMCAECASFEEEEAKKWERLKKNE